MAQLEGKTAVITGSGRGQGLAAALLFAAEGARVVVNDLDAESVDKAVAEIRGAGGEAVGVVGDVSDPHDVQRILGAAQGLGGLDVLYNNAGIGNSATKRFGIGMSDIVNCTLEDWNRIIAINLTGSFLTCKYGIPMLIERGGGAIINTASIHAIVGMSSAHAYSATKGGLTAITRAIAVTYGPQGVRCNAILPGVVETEMIGDALASAEIRDQFVQGTPSRRAGTAEDMANVALWLAGDGSSFVNGQDIVVDGGASIYTALIAGRSSR
jgi:NAD(P)-dependent dehydrogenase (short-subunit alcohol dehydrogenase family)